ncbi:MAG: F0F1 ATP synthase subunit delta [Mycobacteriales bacterium]
MQVASREALAQGRTRLDEREARSGSTRLSTLAGDLLAVGRLLAREPVLRRSLSDPAAPEDVRRELLDAVAGKQVGKPATELLHDLVSSRWSSPADLVDACELLAVQALLAAAEADDALPDVEDQLFRFLRVCAGDAELRATLADSTAAVDRRERLVDDLLKGNAHAVTQTLVKLALGGLSGRGFEASLERMVELAAQRRDHAAAYVTVATGLTRKQESELEATLARIYGRKMSLLIVVDPSILGGMTVRVGDELYDGSVARRLAQVRSGLAG